jgi:P-aminobenzoate N-oxygenase AurF
MTTAMTARHGFTYPAILEVAERINWRVEDLIGGDKRLDFSQAFLPESLARIEPLTFLTPRERLALNHIRAAGYLHVFGVVEEFIVPFVLKYVEQDVRGESYQIRSFLEFAGEEAKHIHLFRRFKEEFDAGFGAPCQLIGPSTAIGDAVLAHDELAVALVILQIEWMTQRHYVDSVANNEQLDPQFRSLLRHHWMEEAQHAKLDVLLVEALAARRTPAQIAGAVDEYLEIGGFLDAGLRQQVDFDLATLEHITGRSFTAAERRLFAMVQTQALRWTYLGSGMTHPKFLESVGRLGPGLRHRIEAVAPAFC